MLLPTSSEYLVKIAHGIRPCGAFISEILVKFSVWGPKPHPRTNLGEIWRGRVDGRLLHVTFHPDRCNVSTLPGEKSQNRPESPKYRRYALRAMLLF